MNTVQEKNEEMVEWIFGYGSLIWRPGFEYIDSSLAVLSGWRREFSQDSPDHRGTPELPGRVVTLRQDKNACCEGLAYKVSPTAFPSIVSYLDERESGGYTREYIDVALQSKRRVRALTYVALPGNPHASGPTPAEQLVRLVAERRGPSGENREYVVNLAKALNAYGIYDPAVEVLMERLSLT